MFRKLKAFHEKTLQEYKKGIEETLEPWKKHVMEIHEKAIFLFYVEEMEEDFQKPYYTIRGDLAKGFLEKGSPICFLSGEGEKLGDGILRSEPEEKEEHRKGMFRHKREEFQVEILTLRGIAVSEMNDAVFQKVYRKFHENLSFVADDTNKCSEIGT